jgi:deoxycytidylate deaminase
MLIASGIKHIIFAEHYKDDSLVNVLCINGNVSLSIFENNEITKLV